MDWTIALLAVAVIAALFLLKRMSFVSEATARQHLANGALVIDVRSTGEFQGGHVSGAVNIPLGDVGERVREQVKDKQQVLLVHCLSGGRSAIVQRQLKNMGYANVFNLGSLARAKKIVEPRATD